MYQLTFLSWNSSLLTLVSWVNSASSSETLHEVQGTFCLFYYLSLDHRYYTPTALETWIIGTFSMKGLNSLLNDKISALSNLTAFADDNRNVAQNIIFCFNP